MVVSDEINWKSTCYGEKEKSEKLAAEGLEPRVSGRSRHNR